MLQIQANVRKGEASLSQMASGCIALETRLAVRPHHSLHEGGAHLPNLIKQSQMLSDNPEPEKGAFGETTRFGPFQVRISH